MCKGNLIIITGNNQRLRSASDNGRRSKRFSGLLIFRGKKAKFRGIFRGKFAEKSADFAGFSREKSQNSPENRSISRDFSGKKSNFEGFSGANS